MAVSADNASMALFCDFENIALGVRDAKYEKFDIRPVLERLLAKGSIVVKKAYCDWDRYKGFKATMHEANFELIEIPHVRQSGKNSADIRLVVDALDLCYTKSHVDTFVIISGDSDFSPLVSKLRENAKQVIGVGVKQSTSDLLIANCDEFIYYDDLVRDRDAERGNARRENRDAAPKRTPEEESKRREKMEARKAKAVELAADTLNDLMTVRSDTDRVWASVLKEVIKRRNPGFNESYFGFRSFGNLLEEAAARGLLAVGRDEKSGTYVMRAQPRMQETLNDVQVEAPLLAEQAAPELVPASDLPVTPAAEQATGPARRRGGRRSRKAQESADSSADSPADPVQASPEPVVAGIPAAEVPQALTVDVEKSPKKPARKPRTRRPATQSLPESASPAPTAPLAAPAAEVRETPVAESLATKPARQRKPRSRKPREAGEAAVSAEQAD